MLPIDYWLHHAVFYALLVVIHYLNGQWVFRRGIKVNYTRKINHFAFFFLPPLLRSVLPYEYTAAVFFTDIVLVFMFLALYIKPIRQRVRLINVMFTSFDRPEDRPHTLLWLSTQFLAAYIVLIPFLTYFSAVGAIEWIMIIILVNGIGDGLAEPVGVRFGKHTYETKALFTKKRYTRSIEGSLCVLITGFLVVLAFHSQFNQVQFWVALIVLPIALTLAEAKSPHT